MKMSFFESRSDLDQLDLPKLKVDQALVRVHSKFPSSITLYEKSSLCYQCPLLKVQDISPGDNVSLNRDSVANWQFAASVVSESKYLWPNKNNSSLNCNLQNVDFGQFGVYDMTIEDDLRCDLVTTRQPDFEYSGIVIVSSFFLVIYILCYSINALVNCCIKRKLRNPDLHMTNIDAKEGSKSEGSESQKKIRLKSLDVFRGITILLMILVNHGGGSYWFFQHAPWNGLRLADVIFPWFIWIMGVCIPMNIRSQLRKEISKAEIFWIIVKRSVKLFCIGLILNSIGGHNSLESYRIPGVLQRFGVAYFVCASLMLFLSPSPNKVQFIGCYKHFDDVIRLFAQWFVHLSILAGYICFMFLMPVPGCPSGYFGPGGLHLFQNDSPSPHCIGGVAKMVDSILLGDSHIYQHPTAKAIFQSSAFDPEGILGVVPTLFQVFLGIQAGQILLSFKSQKARLFRWIFWGIVCTSVGLALSGGDFMGGPIPVNKNLWSISYVFVTSGFAFVLLAFCYLICDYVKLWSGAPFYQIGMNSIFLYVGHFFTYNVFPWRYKYGKMDTHLMLFIEAAWGAFLWTLIAIYLHKKKKFYTI